MHVRDVVSVGDKYLWGKLYWNLEGWQENSGNCGNTVGSLVLPNLQTSTYQLPGQFLGVMSAIGGMFIIGCALPENKKPLWFPAFVLFILWLFLLFSYISLNNDFIVSTAFLLFIYIYIFPSISYLFCLAFWFGGG